MTKKSLLNSFLLICLVFIMGSCQRNVVQLKLSFDSSSPQVSHGMDKLHELSLSGKIRIMDNNPDIEILTTIDSVLLSPEAFQIVIDNRLVKVIGGDATGLMYGLLDIREQLESGQKTIISKTETPHLPFRAIKFNLPWMSYRTGEALQLHSETVRDTIFWNSFLDMMAENRFNKLTLWSQHPFIIW
jgi:hypothetical protein